MNRRNIAHRLCRQSGIGLVELMVGITIGLVIVIALAYFFLGSRQVGRTTDDVSRMQESGRNGLEVLGSAIRQAGYRSNVNAAFGGTVVYSGSTCVTGTGGTGLCGAGEGSSAPDTITVQYDAQDGGEVDCTGNNIASGVVTYAFAVNTTSNPPALTCNGTAVVDNIEDMQITYGIDANKDGTIESYKTAPTALEFAQVAAVRVSLLVRGPSTNVAANKTQTYTDNGASVTKTDGYLRQVYGATFAVRRQAW